jgi:hypothetical protein
MPILPTGSSPKFSKEVMKHLKPSVIFSAHDHRGLDFSLEKSQKIALGNVTIFTQKRNIEDHDSEPLEQPKISLHQSDTRIHEIIVPTCSYRMGVKQMALMTCLGSKCKQALWLVWAPAAARPSDCC